MGFGKTGSHRRTPISQRYAAINSQNFQGLLFVAAYLWWIDDGCKLLNSKHPEVGDCEGAIVKISGLQLVVSSLHQDTAVCPSEAALPNKIFLPCKSFPPPLLRLYYAANKANTLRRFWQSQDSNIHRLQILQQSKEWKLTRKAWGRRCDNLIAHM